MRKMNAICGHEDMLGYFTNTPCLKCVKAEHAKVMGKGK